MARRGWTGTDWCPSGQAWRLVMMVLSPRGYQHVIPHFTRTLDKEVIHGALGGQDLAMWCEPGKNLAGTGTTEGVLSSSEIFCVPWTTTSPRAGTPWRAFTPNLRSGHCRLISFMKLSPRVVAEVGLRAEFALLDHLAHADAGGDGVEVSALATLAWPEILVTFDAPDVGSALHRYLACCHEAEFAGRRLVHKTFSFLCFHSDIFSVDKETFERALPIFPDATADRSGSSDRPFHLHGLLRSTTDASSQLARSIASRYPSTEFTLGPTDILLDPSDPDARGEFVWDMLNYRRIEPTIHGSRIVVGAPVDGVESGREDGSRTPTTSYQPSPPHAAIIRLDRNDILTVEKLGPHLSETLIRSLYAFNSLLQDPVESSAWWDMIANLNLMRREATADAAPQDLLEKRRWMARHLSTFKKGYEQRSAGTFTAFDAPPTPVVTLQGGLNRLLIALQQVVWSAAHHELGREWSGFAVVGSPGSNFQVEAGVVEIPFEHLGLPCANHPSAGVRNLFPLLHESLHAADTVDPVFDLEGPVFMEFQAYATEAAEARPATNDRAAEGTALRLLLTEIGADSFAVEICLGGDLDTWVRAAREYLDRSLEDGTDIRSERLLTRFACLYMGSVLRHEPARMEEELPDVSASSNPTFDSLLCSFWTWLDQTLEEPKIKEDLRTKVTTATAYLAAYLPYLYKRLDLLPLPDTPPSPREPPNVVHGPVDLADPDLRAEALLAEALVDPCTDLDHMMTLYLTWWDLGIRRLGLPEEA